MNAVYTAMIFQNAAGASEQPEYLKPLDGLRNELELATLDPFL